MTPQQAIRTFVAAVHKDFSTVQRYRQKYHSDTIPLTRLPAEFVTKIGFQTTTAVRVMQLFGNLRLPLLPQVMSRLIRHVYASEIHWDAQIDPGLNIIHGIGLIISRSAQVSEGCILFQNVTLGESTDPVSRKVGAPKLGRDVHVGPGATLLGPIEVGEGSKIMAGAVLAHSVPKNSLVRPAESVTVARKPGKATAAVHCAIAGHTPGRADLK
jgi:serine acetyltransferase